MEITGIKFMAPFYDGSGYAEAARQYVAALYKMGVPLTLQNISFEEARPEVGEYGAVLKELMDKDIPYNVKIIQLTPEHYPLYKEENVLNIGYSFWETSKLCREWISFINDNIQMCFVPCTWNQESYINSGVTVPVKRIFQGIDMSEFEDVKEYNLNGVGENTYLFYSIFQWTERKNPMALLKAYWNAFTPKDDVALVLKTYRSNYSDAEKNAIKATIMRLKQVMPMDYYPKVLLIPDILSREEIIGLHKRGDCFALIQRGEGWGMPHFEAGAMGNPVLTTGMGGNMEFTTPENSYLVDYSWTPVFGMPWCPWYRGDQWWSEPDVGHTADLLRHVYDNREEARQKGIMLREFIKSNFDWSTVSKDMIEYIREV